MNDYNIKEVNEDNKKDWDAFNEKVEDGSFYHTLKWKEIIEKSFNLISHSFFICNKDEIIGLCPIFELKINKDKGLEILPESDYNSLIIKKENINEKVLKLLIEKIRDIASSNKLDFSIIHLNYSSLFDLSKKYDPLTYPILGTMELDINKYPPKKLWDEVFSKKNNQRKYIKRFEKDGYKIREIRSKKDIEIFYDYYKKNLIFIKAAPYSFNHFKNLLDTYSSDEMRITITEKDGIVAGGLLAFLYPAKKTMYLRYLSLNRELPNKYHPPYPLYWDAILKASELGFEKVSFGSTQKDPEYYNYRLKEKFGCSYKDIYSFVISYSTTFKLKYNIYRFLKKID